MQLTGCAGVRVGGGGPSVVADRESAELAELFGESAPGAAEADAVAGGEVPFSPFDEPFPEAPEVSFSPLPAMDMSVEVYRWDVIGGGKLGNFVTGVVDGRFVRPVAVAVRGDYIYVVDAGQDLVLRYNQATGRLESLLDLRSAVKGEVADIYVAKDLSFYITDTEGGRVLQYDADGRLLQLFSNRFNLTRPVSVNVLDSGDVIVADGHFDHLLHFGADGVLLATYGGRGEGAAQFLNITSLALGPDGFYVGARVGRRVQVISLDGNYSYSFEEGRAIFPAAIAVDRNNRSYVADLMDNQIKVFDRGRLIATLGGSGVGPGRFMRITDMWLDERFLYVVDSLNGRIQAARLVPEGVSGAGFNPFGR